MMKPLFSARIIPALSYRLTGLLLLAAAASGQTAPDARLALGIDRFEQKRYAEAAANLDAARLKLPQLTDYTSYYLASAHSELKEYGRVAADLPPLSQR